MKGNANLSRSAVGKDAWRLLLDGTRALVDGGDQLGERRRNVGRVVEHLDRRASDEWVCGLKD